MWITYLSSLCPIHLFLRLSMSSWSAWQYLRQEKDLNIQEELRVTKHTNHFITHIALICNAVSLHGFTNHWIKIEYWVIRNVQNSSSHPRMIPQCDTLHIERCKSYQEKQQIWMGFQAILSYCTTWPSWDLANINYKVGTHRKQMFDQTMNYIIHIYMNLLCTKRTPWTRKLADPPNITFCTSWVVNLYTCTHYYSDGWLECLSDL